MFFVSFERIDIIQITNIAFYQNRFSSRDLNLRAMGCFKIQLLLAENTWSILYDIHKNDHYSNSSTGWSLVSLNFTVESYATKIKCDQTYTALADLCCSNITITHSVYKMDNINYFKDLFESISDCKKILPLLFLIKNDNDIIQESGFLKKRFQSSV